MVRRAGSLAALALIGAWCAAVPATEALPATAPSALTPDAARALVVAIKERPRGPFDRVLWYCKDGSVLPPKLNACEPHGGGYQHGDYTADLKRLRAAGYPIANLLVRVEPGAVAGPQADPDLLPILVVERFLVTSDDGWIFRNARSLRGAVQDHNEKEAARVLLDAIASSGAPFLVLREAARAFPHGNETASMATVRGLAASLDDRDPGFHALRASIHNAPGFGDAARVRAYAAGASAKPALMEDYAELARSIEEAYRPASLSTRLRALSRWLPRTADNGLKVQLASVLAAETGGQPLARLEAAAEALRWLRVQAEAVSPSRRMPFVDASLAAEAQFLVAASQASVATAPLTREQRLQLLTRTATALYGAGLLTDREWQQLSGVGGQLGQEPTIARYREGLESLERASAWCASRLQYHFGNGVERLQPIEPLAKGLIADRLRASPALFYSGTLQLLRDDVDQLSEAGQKLFGASGRGGLRRLNPGLARGVLHTSTKAGVAGAAPAIYLVPETTSDLPAAAGILTEQEGNPVSHVQLLARNLGIPNVVVARQLLSQLAPHEGKPVVVAASVGGLVEISEDGPEWDRVFGSKAPASGVVVEPDLFKLDLLRAEFVPTSALSAADSGRIVGPKAAHVGELAKRFPGQVSPGLAVSFGIYRQMLGTPMRKGGPSMFSWMRQQYADIAVRRQLDPAGHARRVSGFLATVRQWITTQPMPPALQWRLADAMRASFGMEGTYGVFVRSDTNIEDLPGFTGAGLNQTIPNVVGFDATVKAIREVWASPFTERAYGWRQDLMTAPEHVYASVLLHQSGPNEKSGVMITADVDTGARDALTVATSLGVGGGVDGEASESLRISLDDGSVQLLSSATARRQRQLLLGGGAKLVRAPAPERVLSASQIATLTAFARQLPRAYPELRDEEGESAAADVEFGFVGEKLMLLQIRPFLQNRAAARQQYLAKMDQQLKKRGDRRVDMDATPELRS